MTDDDRDLRARFAALRQEDEARRPDFSVFWGPAGRPRPRWGGRLAAVAVVLVTMMTAILFLRSPRREPAPHVPKPVTSIIEWKAPTDFLLETPGRELLETVPQIGQWPGHSASPGRGRKPAGKKASPTKEES